MNWQKIKDILKDEPKFRFSQMKRALFIDLVDDFSEIANFPKTLREKLSQDNSLEIKAELSEAGNSSKALLVLEDGQKVETVLMKHRDGRHTVCLSSQVGCPLACTFCATGKEGFKRQLSFEEILDQMRFWAKYLKDQGKITNVVFMGMGEPFLNYDAVMEAIKFINDPEGFGIGARKISISTIGITEGIEKLSHEKLQINLAISWHAVNDMKRLKLMPGTKKYPIKKLLESIDNYFKKTGRQIMIEYLLLANFNDFEDDANALADLFFGREVVINLLHYNPTGVYRASSDRQVKLFESILQDRSIKCSRRQSLGREIEAACGQLAAKSK